MVCMTYRTVYQPENITLGDDIQGYQPENITLGDEVTEAEIKLKLWGDKMAILTEDFLHTTVSIQNLSVAQYKVPKELTSTPSTDWLLQKQENRYGVVQAITVAEITGCDLLQEVSILELYCRLSVYVFWARSLTKNEFQMVKRECCRLSKCSFWKPINVSFIPTAKECVV